MPRTIIDLPADQITEVDRLCQALGISRAEAVRRALKDFLAGAAEVRTDGFGLWREAATAQAAATSPATPRRRKTPRP